MPDGGNTWAISGAAGVLKAGSRTAAEFASWQATRQEEGAWRISAESVESDPYWLENATAFKAALQMGRGEVRGPAVLVCAEPLVFDMRIGE